MNGYLRDFITTAIILGIGVIALGYSAIFPFVGVIVFLLVRIERLLTGLVREKNNIVKYYN